MPSRTDSSVDQRAGQSINDRLRRAKKQIVLHHTLLASVSIGFVICAEEIIDGFLTRDPITILGFCAAAAVLVPHFNPRIERVKEAKAKFDAIIREKTEAVTAKIKAEISARKLTETNVFSNSEMQISPPPANVTPALHPPPRPNPYHPTL